MQNSFFCNKRKKDSERKEKSKKPAFKKGNIPEKMGTRIRRKNDFQENAKRNNRCRKKNNVPPPELRTFKSIKKNV